MVEGTRSLEAAARPRGRHRRRSRWAPLVAGLKKAWFLGWLALAVALTWGILRALDYLSA